MYDFFYNNINSIPIYFWIGFIIFFTFFLIDFIEIKQIENKKREKYYTMTYEKFVDDYYSCVVCCKKEITLITLLNIPFYAIGEINENNYIYIIPWIIVIGYFIKILSHVDMGKAKSLHDSNPQEFSNPVTVKYRLAFICGSLFQVIGVFIIIVVYEWIPFVVIRIPLVIDFF